MKCTLHNIDQEVCKKCKANARARKYRAGKGRETRKAYEAKWLANGGKEIRRKALREYRSRKYNGDIEYRLLHVQRQRISTALKGVGKTKGTLELIVCTMVELITHLENRFNSKMNWDNYGSYWNVDHKFPLSVALSIGIEKFEECCHYTNLQPMEVMENIKKSNKLI